MCPPKKLPSFPSSSKSFLTLREAPLPPSYLSGCAARGEVNPSSLLERLTALAHKEGEWWPFVERMIGRYEGREYKDC